MCGTRKLCAIKEHKHTVRICFCPCVCQLPGGNTACVHLCPWHLLAEVPSAHDIHMLPGHAGVRLARVRPLSRPSMYNSTCGLVAMTSASHAEGRQFNPGWVYFLSVLQPMLHEIHQL